MTQHKITLAEVTKAHEAFEANEPRDLFYRVATELIALALRNATSLTVAEALAVLLQTWNKAYYQYHRFDNAHFASLQRLLSKHQATLARYRDQLIDDLDPHEETAIAGLFHAFEELLGPVGAAKALHLMAPKLFPLWDRAIAKAYDLQLRSRGSNAQAYWRFLLFSKGQCRDLKREDQGCANPLKAVDEYNYCKYTKGWLT